MEVRRSFACLVVGSRRVRRFDPRWPARHTRAHHSVGIGTVVLRDRTKVLGVDPPRRLLLDARLGRRGGLRIAFGLRGNGTGTTLEVVAWPVRGLLARAHGKMESLLMVGNPMSRRRRRLVGRRQEQRRSAGARG